MDTTPVDSLSWTPSTTVPPVDVPFSVWRHHPVLRDAQLNAIYGGLEWPKATFGQLPLLSSIDVVDEGGVLCARIPAQFNFDRFVDDETNENAPAQPPGHSEDRQRFYTRVTESGFHVVGIFCAITSYGRRRYFQWLTASWVEVGLKGFLLARDAHETRFSEVSAIQLDGFQPGASSTMVLTDVVQAQQMVSDLLQHEAEDEPTGRRAAAHRSAPAPNIDDLSDSLVDHLPSPGELAGSAEVSTVQNFPAQDAIAVAIATIVHCGDMDFGGAPSIDHVARVAESFDRETELIRYCAAWLHDVLEVGALSAKDLVDAGVCPEIVEIVSLLSRTDERDEEAWFRAIVNHPDARSIKMRAVADNSAIWRLRRLDSHVRAEVEASCARARQYLSEFTM